MVLCQPQHRVDKVFTILTEDPGSSNDVILIHDLFYQLLARQLGLAVLVLRVGRRVDLVLALVGPVKDVVGADVDQGGPRLLSGLGDVLGTGLVDRPVQVFLFVFGRIHGGKGRAVEDDFRLLSIKTGINGSLIGNVHLVGVKGAVLNSLLI